MSPATPSRGARRPSVSSLSLPRARVPVVTMCSSKNVHPPPPTQENREVCREVRGRGTQPTFLLCPEKDFIFLKAELAFAIANRTMFMPRGPCRFLALGASQPVTCTFLGSDCPAEGPLRGP